MHHHSGPVTNNPIIIKLSCAVTLSPVLEVSEIFTVLHKLLCCGLFSCFMGNCILDHIKTPKSQVFQQNTKMSLDQSKENSKTFLPNYKLLSFFHRYCIRLGKKKKKSKFEGGALMHIKGKLSIRNQEGTAAGKQIHFSMLGLFLIFRIKSSK